MSESRVCRILCIDDNELIGSSLERYIASDPAFSWLGLVSDGQNAEERILSQRPDIVLMDVDMPGVDTFSLVERITAGSSRTRVLMLSGHVDIAYVNRALDVGAWGYLSKNEDVRLLIECVRRVAAGEVVLSPEVEEVHRRSLAQRDAPPEKPPSSGFGIS